MKYALGDKVRLLCTHIPNTSVKVPPGSIGVIETVYDHDVSTNGYGFTLRIITDTQIGESRHWYFSPTDVEPIENYLMTPPDMELDEIHAGQDIMEELS